MKKQRKKTGEDPGFPLEDLTEKMLEQLPATWLTIFLFSNAKACMEMDRKEGQDGKDGGGEFFISKSKWIPPKRTDTSEISSEVRFPLEKPLASSRFSHRKSAKANPQRGRALRVAKLKQHEMLECTWKMIMERKGKPLTRQLRKSDAWENHGRDINVETLQAAANHSPLSFLMKKLEAFRDRMNFQISPLEVGSSPASGKLRRELSLSQDELNHRVEAVTTKFNDEVRLQVRSTLGGRWDSTASWQDLDQRMDSTLFFGAKEKWWVSKEYQALYT